TNSGRSLPFSPRSTQYTSPGFGFIIKTFQRGGAQFPGPGGRFHFFRHGDFRHGHDPPAAVLRRHQILCAFARAPDGDAALVIGFYQGCFHVGIFPPAGSIVNGFSRDRVLFVGRAAVPRRWRSGSSALPFVFGLKAAQQRKPCRVWLRQGGGAPPLAERERSPTVRLWFEGCAAAQPCRVWLRQGGGAPPLAERQRSPTVPGLV